MRDLSVNSVERFGYEQQLKRVLPLGALVFYGLAYINPIGAFTLYGITQQMTHGMFALAFALATLSMCFTAYSYAKMSAAYPVTGSAYSYTQRSINPYLGFFTGWAVLLDYVLLPITNYLLLGLYINNMFPQIPKWTIILFFVIVTSIINIRDIKLTARANTIMTIIQLVFLFAVVFFMLKWLLTGNGAGTLFDLSGLIKTQELTNNSYVGWGMVFTAASTLCLCFLGFDAITTVSEEAIDPEKNIGRAIILTCLLSGALFIGVAYLATLCWPDAWNQMVSPDTGAVELITKVAGSTVGYLFSSIFCVGCFASGISSQASGARLLFAMGRDGVLPKKLFGYVNEKYQTPTYSIIFIGIIGCISVFLDILSAASIINFGALIAFMMVNLSVVSHYFVKGRNRSAIDVVRYLIVPLIGAIIAFSIWINLDGKALTLGFIWSALGILYMIYTTGFFRQLPPEMKFEE